MYECMHVCVYYICVSVSLFVCRQMRVGPLRKCKCVHARFQSIYCNTNRKERKKQIIEHVKSQWQPIISLNYSTKDAKKYPKQIKITHLSTFFTRMIAISS